MSAAKPRLCPGCNTMRQARDFFTRTATGKVYPRCKFCGNPEGKRPVAERVCITCKVSKPLRKGFTQLREASTRAYLGFTDDCKECRKAEGVTRERMAAKAKAREAAKRDEKRNAHKSCAEPVKLTGFNAWLALGDRIDLGPDKHKPTGEKARFYI